MRAVVSDLDLRARAAHRPIELLSLQARQLARWLRAHMRVPLGGLTRAWQWPCVHTWPNVHTWPDARSDAKPARARAGSAAVGPQGGDEGIGGAALALVDAAARERLSDVLGV